MLNLHKYIMPDPVDRPEPLNYHERAKLILKTGEDIVQQELQRFYEFTNQIRFVINRKKC